MKSPGGPVTKIIRNACNKEKKADQLQCWTQIEEGRHHPLSKVYPVKVAEPDKIGAFYGRNEDGRTPKTSDPSALKAFGQKESDDIDPVGLSEKLLPMVHNASSNKKMRLCGDHGIKFYLKCFPCFKLVAHTYILIGQFTGNGNIEEQCFY